MRGGKKGINDRKNLTYKHQILDFYELAMFENEKDFAIQPLDPSEI